MPDDKSDQDVTENDDDEDYDLKAEISNLSNEESVAKVDGNTDEEVRGYGEISVNENDDQLDYKVYEDTDDEVRDYHDISVNENDDKSNNEVCEDTFDDVVKKVKVENQNEFIEVKAERNVVKLLFEGTFKENTEEILENLVSRTRN